MPPARVYKTLLGWGLVVFAGLLVARSYLGQDLLSAGAASYLQGVLVRSFENTFQLALLAAVLAIFPHAGWLFLRAGRGAVGPYGACASWAQTAFTSVGFIGTVIGISLAIAGLSEALAEDDATALITGLSTAFDTTFLGLVGAVCLMVLRKVAELWAGS